MRYGETEVMEIKNLLSKFHKNMKICEKKLKLIFFLVRAKEENFMGKMIQANRIDSLHQNDDLGNRESNNEIE